MSSHDTSGSNPDKSDSDAPAALKESLKGKMPEADIANLLNQMRFERENVGPNPPPSHAFWSTQPVPAYTEIENKSQPSKEGPIEEVDIEKVPKLPSKLPEGYEWVTMDLTEPEQLKVVYDLLCNHYVEDDDSNFRFNYSNKFLDWALKPPGWKKQWHVGVRVSKNKKVVAFISAIPAEVQVREKVLKVSEVNFLCVHKKLRGKRLAPVLIREVTRRCNMEGIFQGLYTAGVVVPTPIATCRYYHRTLDFEKLESVGFSSLPEGVSRHRQLVRFKLPSTPLTPGLRPMTKEDIPTVLDLLGRYLDRFKIGQRFSAEEADHWFLNAPSKDQVPDETDDPVIYAYVAETEGKVTDLFSFYRLESSVLKENSKSKIVRAAYLYYYATETAFKDSGLEYKQRLNMLIKDALILAKKANFDVFNALTILDNPLFLEEQKFGPGDGNLNYYLFNYRTAAIPSGVDAKNRADPKHMGGIGVVML